MSDFVCDFEAAVARSWFATRCSDTHALLAVSGGADSVGLLRSMCAIVPDHSRIAVAHFNHGWRGEESDGDEAFVRHLSAELNLEFHAGRPATTKSNSQDEATARKERYRFLESTANDLGARCIVTAHHAEDRLETVLHNLFRGTGLAGVAGIRKTRPIGEELVLVRPMLEIRKADILRYLTDIQQQYREDSSNSELHYKRNFLRRSIAPLLDEQYSAWQEGVLRFADSSTDILDFLDSEAKLYLARVEKLDPDFCDEQQGFRIPNAERLPVPWVVLHRTMIALWSRQHWPLGKMTARHWQRIRQAHEQGGTGQDGFVDNLPNSITLSLQNCRLVFRRLASS